MTWKPHPRKDILVSCEGTTLRQAFRDAEQEARAEIRKSKKRLSAVRVVIQLRDMTKPPPKPEPSALIIPEHVILASKKRAAVVAEWMKTRNASEAGRILGISPRYAPQLLRKSARIIKRGKTVMFPRLSKIERAHIEDHGVSPDDFADAYLEERVR